MKKKNKVLFIIGGLLIGLSVVVNFYFSIIKYGYRGLSTAALMSYITSPIGVVGIIFIAWAFILEIKSDKK